MASEKITLPSQLPVAPWTERFSGTPQEKLRWRVQSCQARRGYKFTTTSKFTCVITKLMTSSMGLLLRCISVWHTNQQTMWLISSSCADRHLVNYTIWDFVDTQFNKEYHVLLLTFCLCRHMGFITSIVKVGVQIHYITKRFQWSLEAPIDSQGQISFSTVALSCIMTSWRGGSGPYDSYWLLACETAHYNINTPPPAQHTRTPHQHLGKNHQAHKAQSGMTASYRAHSSPTVNILMPHSSLAWCFHVTSQQQRGARSTNLRVDPSKPSISMNWYTWGGPIATYAP